MLKHKTKYSKQIKYKFINFKSDYKKTINKKDILTSKLIEQ